MLLRPGYSYAAVSVNVATLHRAGYTREMAVAEAYCAGRRAFFKRHPGGLLPAWLAYPRGNRERAFYDRNGIPIRRTRADKIGKQEFRQNPSPPNREIEQAARLFKRFTGRPADRIDKIPLQPLPKTGLAFGEMVEIGYISYRDGLPYRHSFRPLRSRPLLVSTHDGKQVLLIGGSYAFTERGIVNK